MEIDITCARTYFFCTPNFIIPSTTIGRNLAQKLFFTYLRFFFHLNAFIALIALPPDRLTHLPLEYPAYGSTDSTTAATGYGKLAFGSKVSPTAQFPLGIDHIRFPNGISLIPLTRLPSVFSRLQTIRQTVLARQSSRF